MKKRLDIFLVENGYFQTRQKAQNEINNGIIYVDGKQITKTSYQVDENASIEIRGETLKYVSRGGLKLEKALKVFEIDVKDKICLDIGSSTGGFTDCLLQNDAKYVYAVDVGSNQLADKLINNNKVCSMENTNINDCTKNSFKDDIDFFCTDVSFVSLEKILDSAYSILKDDGIGVCLIKPQFELDKSALSKNGIVKERKDHVKAINNVIEYAKSIGFSILGLDFSPIKGGEGNIEYLICLKKKRENSIDIDAIKVVESAHNM